MRSTLALLTAFSLMAGFATASLADVVSLAASKDNTLYEDSEGGLSNGAGDYFFAGKTAGGLIRRGVIAFDVAAEIPEGSTINSVTLTLSMSQTSAFAGARSVGLHRLLDDWGEGASNATFQGGGQGEEAALGDATWLHTFSPEAFWAALGGDFVNLSSDVQVVDGTGSYVWGSTAAMVSDVQSWLDLPSGNFGWAVVGDEIATQTAKRFDSRTNQTPELQPVLEITYVPEPGSLLLQVAALGVVGLLARRRPQV